MLADLGLANALQKMQEDQSKAMASRFAGKLEDDVATVEKKPDSPDAEPKGESLLWPTALEVLIFWWTQGWPKTPMNHMEDSDESHETPPEDGQEGRNFSSLSRKISDISSGLLATAGYALCGVRAKASKLAESAERRFGFRRTSKDANGEVANGESLIVEVVRVADLGASQLASSWRFGCLVRAWCIVGKTRPRRVYVSLQL